MDIDESIFDRERFERVWSRVMPDSVTAKPPEEKEELSSLLALEREMRGVYGSLAAKKKEFEPLWHMKESACRHIAAEQYLKTGLLAESAGKKRKVSVTAENLRLWYVTEQRIRAMYGELNMDGGENCVRCCEKLRSLLEEML